MFLVLFLGCVLGWVFSVWFYTDDMVGNWATFLGAGGGAIITVFGLAWHEASKNARDDAGMALRMTPHLIVLRGKLRAGMNILKTYEEEEHRYRHAVSVKTDEAIEAWLMLQTHLDHFPDVAVDCFRLDEAFKELKKNRVLSFNHTTYQSALEIATHLATRFKADDNLYSHLR